MKVLSIASLAGLTAASIQMEWSDFKSLHNKKYSPLEESRRFNIFKENKAFIARHNKDYQLGIETYTVGLNKFADMTNDEFHSQYLSMTKDVSQDSLSIRLNYQCPVVFTSNGNTANSVDWRTTENPQNTVAVTSVKDQGSCGSCWSFGGAAAFEGSQCIAGNHDCSTWTGASEQELVDCGGSSNAALGPYYDMACNGGWIDNALYYILQTGYIDSYDSYPYVSGTTRQAGTCVSSSANSSGSLSDCGATQKNSEPDMQDALSQIGPLGIAIDAGGIGFQLYTSGVYTSTSCSSTRVNHAVTAVGYGADSAGTEYWTVKNSWGKSWGDNGFILMRRNYNNMCAVASTPCYAIV